MTDATTTRPSATDEDSDFDSQSKPLSRPSSRPITDAVNEWLNKRANSPDLFVTSSATSDNDDQHEDDDDDDDEDEDDDDYQDEDDDDASVSNEPSKNLQGNPVPALSVNGGADERPPSLGKFATTADRTQLTSGEVVHNNASSTRTRKSTRCAKSKGAAAARAREISNLKTSEDRLINHHG